MMWMIPMKLRDSTERTVQMRRMPPTWARPTLPLLCTFVLVTALSWVGGSSTSDAAPSTRPTSTNQKAPTSRWAVRTTPTTRRAPMDRWQLGLAFPKAKVRLDTIAALPKDKVWRYRRALLASASLDNWQLRHQVTIKLKGYGEKLFPDLRWAMEHKSWRVRMVALEIQLYLRDRAVALLPELVLLVQRDKQSWVRWQVANVLGSFGPKAKAAIPALSHALQYDADTKVASAAMHALGQIGPVAYKGLYKGLKHKEYSIREVTMRKIGSLGAKAASAIPHLLPLLQSKDLEQRMRTIRTLGKIGPKAKVALPTLLQLKKKEKDKLLLRYLAGALKKIQGGSKPRKRTTAAPNRSKPHFRHVSSPITPELPGVR